MYGIAPTILMTAVLACAMSETPGAHAPDRQTPTDLEPPDEPLDNQHFCCKEVDPKNLSGEDCTAIAKEHINNCSNVLYCAGSWTKKDGAVTCG